MPFIPTPNVARCAVRYILHNQSVVNTLWFRKDIGLQDPALAMADLGNAISSWVETNLLSQFSTDVFFADVTATSQVSATAPSVVTVADLSGLAVGGAMPGNVCWTLKFSTAQRGRSGRGRNYISGMRETDVTGNQVNTTWAGNIYAAYNTLISLPPDGWEWVVVSHYENLQPRIQGFAQTVLSASIVNYDVDSQRRRLTGRGS